MSKYGNKKVETPDGVFDSKKEYQRWCELKLLEKAGEISFLQRQVPFELIPAQREWVGTKSKVIERAVNYIADFVYMENGKMVAEDTKGFKTKEYIIKRKLLLKEWGIRIREV